MFRYHTQMRMCRPNWVAETKTAWAKCWQKPDSHKVSLQGSCGDSGGGRDPTTTKNMITDALFMVQYLTLPGSPP